MEEWSLIALLCLSLCSDLSVIQLYVCHAVTAPVICILRRCNLALAPLIFCFTPREIARLKRSLHSGVKGRRRHRLHRSLFFFNLTLVSLLFQDPQPSQSKKC